MACCKNIILTLCDPTVPLRVKHGEVAVAIGTQTDNNKETLNV